MVVQSFGCGQDTDLSIAAREAVRIKKLDRSLNVKEGTQMS